MPYKDPEKRKEHYREWSKTHREYFRAWRAEHREATQESGRKSMAKWRENHPIEAQETQQKYRELHAEEIRARDRARWPDRSEASATRMKEWRESHREQNANLKRRYRASKNNAPGFHSASDVAEIYEAQDGRCYYCDEVLDQTYHVDHKQPLSRGGSDWPENLCCACQPCNNRKKDRTESEFVLRQFAGSPCSS